MRRLLMLIVGFLASVFMFAESVDKTQALRKAQKFMPGKIFKEVQPQAFLLLLRQECPI